MRKALFAQLALLALPLPSLALTGAQLQANIQATTTGAGSPDFTITPPAVGTFETNVAGFGANPGNTGAQNYTAFAAAITTSASPTRGPMGR